MNAQYSPVTVQQYPFVANATSRVIIASQAARRSLIIQNNGLNDLLVSFGVPVESSGSNAIVIPPRGLSSDLAILQLIYPPVDSVNIMSVGGTNGVIIEGRMPE